MVGQKKNPQEYRFNVYIRTAADRRLMKRAKAQAERERRSLSAWVLLAIEEALKGREK